ncbi:uncharacterized protein BO97DRAFT_237092 [Aspergillus homomorphus CBS 101889]|uniref:Uncharacterized protein n=1 Tax=Aspergillus homomorphus (strain CBS 101889) TaxID=1450537 RepID=A0A395I7J5_ASPHC|nr:hypothetical protein BO97DRAFT_237092 [Aspergillus homomorphus CBS 101889]RAL15048.1 hypothetical protein BO97DRAFT_237092 [Aspergillus homomorphus CBS 101889]
MQVEHRDMLDAQIAFAHSQCHVGTELLNLSQGVSATGGCYVSRHGDQGALGTTKEVRASRAPFLLFISLFCNNLCVDLFFSPFFPFLVLSLHCYCGSMPLGPAPNWIWILLSYLLHPGEVHRNGRSR